MACFLELRFNTCNITWMYELGTELICITLQEFLIIYKLHPRTWRHRKSIACFASFSYAYNFGIFVLTKVST